MSICIVSHVEFTIFQVISYNNKYQVKQSPDLAFQRRLGSNCVFTSCSDCSFLASSHTGLPNNNPESFDTAILSYEGSLADVKKCVEFCGAKDGALKLKLANGTEADELTAFAFAANEDDWPNTKLVVAAVTAAKGLEDIREAATSENDGTADAEHGIPNILSVCSIIKNFFKKLQNHSPVARRTFNLFCLQI